MGFSGGRSYARKYWYNNRSRSELNSNHRASRNWDRRHNLPATIWELRSLPAEESLSRLRLADLEDSRNLSLAAHRKYSSKARNFADMTALSPPPHTILSTERFSQSSAHAFLSDFLTRAAVEPALRPDSTLSEQGPVANSTSGTQNLTLYHLDRIQQGLEGKNLGVGSVKLEEGLGELDNYHDGEEGFAQVSTKKEGRKKKRKRLEEEEAAVGEGDGMDWQNRSEFEREQSIEEGEMGNREGGPREGAEEVTEEVIEAETGKVADIDGEGLQPLRLEKKEKEEKEGKRPKSEKEKAERKAAKKAKRKAEQRAKFQG